MKVDQNGWSVRLQIDSNGARVVVARLPLTPDCPDGDAIDAAIEVLKDDLDSVAVKMKAALRRQTTQPKATVSLESIRLHGR
jgi:hypothetical protein